MELLFWKQYWR